LKTKGLLLRSDELIVRKWLKGIPSFFSHGDTETRRTQRKRRKKVEKIKNE
jgi:hypothetical protein